MKFGIIRIFGNELPPRDKPGEKLRILEYILKNEKPHAKTEKWWLVNHIHDTDFMIKGMELMVKYGSRFIFLPFSHDAVIKANSTTEKMVAAIPINMCRNVAVEFGSNRFDYTAVLDGDCYFLGDEWADITDAIEQDQSRIYYSLPMVRTSIELLDQGNTQGPYDEPQIIMHSSAKIRFDETLPWGNFRDKLDVLIKLKHKDVAGYWHMLENDNHCKIIGKVFHLASGPHECELEWDGRARANMLWELREQGFNLYMSRLGCVVIPNIAPGAKCPVHLFQEKK